MADGTMERTIRTATVLALDGARARLRIGADADRSGAVQRGHEEEERCEPCVDCTCAGSTSVVEAVGLDTVGVQPGESVLVEVSARRAVLAGTLLFAVPLAGTVIGAFLGDYLGLVGLGAGFGLLLGVVPICGFRRLFVPERGSVRIIERLNSVPD